MSAFKTLTTDNIDVSNNIVVSNSSGDAGYIIQRNSDNSNQEWVPKNVYLVVARQDDYDINSGDEYLNNGVVLYQQGQSFEFNGDGTFTCIKTGTYLFVLNGRFDTFNGQSKMRIVDGTNEYGVGPLIYIPGSAEIQSWSATILLPAEIGQVWRFRWESYGVGGTINTIFEDPDYSNLTCSVTIMN
jgi:hypothetical protein